jgi:hypothetical protein
MTEGRQPFDAEIKTLAKGPSTYDPLENAIRRLRTDTGVAFAQYTGHSLKARRTSQIDPELPFRGDCTNW